MNVTRGLLTVLSLLCRTESRCSPTSYYKNCWIRRFPGVYIDVEESQRRGAQLLRFYQEETALKCSRTCCLTRNFSCNLAIFHYDTTQGNCFHLLCPTLESCILSRRGNVVLYNITKGVDPDLLVFGKYFTSNVRVLPHHYGRVNASEPLPSDKRQFIHPPPSPPPLTSAPAAPPSSPGGTVAAATPQTPPSIHQPPAVPGVLTAPPEPSSPAVAMWTQTFIAVTSDSTQTPPTPAPPSSSMTTQSSTASSTHQSTTGLTSPTHSHPIAESSERHPDATEAGVGRNHTATGGGAGGQGAGGEDAPAGLGPGWQVAAHTLLVAVAVCVTVLLSCCCSVLLVASWRGQRRRMGRYRTSWRRKHGSMRLIKYVLVRENS